MKSALIAAAVLALTAGEGHAQTQVDQLLLDPVFQDHAVLQRGKPVPVWGRARPGETVTVTVGQTTATATTDRSGRWRANLPAMAPGGPFEVTARAGSATQRLTDVLVGDVWLCSGQSNMEFGVRQATNAEVEIANSTDPNIRIMLVGRANLPRPSDALPAGTTWQVAGPTTVPAFSAACFFMGKHLRQSQDVPIGLISASWGGSIIEDWHSEASLKRAGDYSQALEILDAYSRSPAEGEALWLRHADQWWDRNDPGMKAGWSGEAVDDANWATVAPEGFWETAIPDMEVFDGSVWFRTTVQLTAAQAAGEARLNIGPVDDLDSTFVNGRQVGAAQGWDTPRDYVVPAGTLHAGANVIAVGVLDTGGGGGAWGPAETKRLTLADGSTVLLAAPWRYRVSAPLIDLPTAPRAPWIGGSGTTTLYNGMIAPLGPYALAGFAWYQGESNTGDPDGYTRLMPGLMREWRTRFEGPELPFLMVQLANFGPADTAPVQSDWAGLREIQRHVVDADPHAGMAVAIDIGDRYDIHPTNKQEVGRRLALAARAVAYGDTTVARTPGPLGATLANGQVVVAFDHAPNGLVTYGASDAVGFELCDTAFVCRYVGGTVKGATVVLDASPGATDFVRFCWANSPVCNLYGEDNLPAVPFQLAVR